MMTEGRAPGADKPRRRRRREDRHTLALLYGQLHARVPAILTEEALGAEFSDKELRILMRENGLMINTYSPAYCRYVEKTKHEKISMLLRIIPRLIHPDTVRARVLLTKSRQDTAMDGCGDGEWAMSAERKLQQNPNVHAGMMPLAAQSMWSQGQGHALGALRGGSGSVTHAMLHPDFVQRKRPSGDWNEAGGLSPVFQSQTSWTSL